MVSERKVILTSTLLTLITLAVFSQAQQPQPKVESKAPRPTATPPNKPDEDVVRITTNLVQVDATVTDKQGRQVSDLTASEFEIVEGGRSFGPEYCSYVSLRSSNSEGSSGAQPSAGELGPRFCFHRFESDYRTWLQLFWSQRAALRQYQYYCTSYAGRGFRSFVVNLVRGYSVK